MTRVSKQKDKTDSLSPKSGKRRKTSKRLMSVFVQSYYMFWILTKESKPGFLGVELNIAPPR